METIIWNALLSLVVTIMATALKSKADEVKALRENLQATREDIARNHVTRIEFTHALDKISEKVEVGFNRLDEKIDKLIQAKFHEK
jgi:predicted Holliday junction resolvase-like endonuclease